MIPATTAVSSRYSWTRHPFSRGFELKSEGALVGTLLRPSFWKSSFEAETSAGRWFFRRCGFWGTGAEIVDAASSLPIANFKGTWANRGVLTFSDGQSFSVQCKGLWHPTWSVRGQSGENVLFVHTREKTAEVSASAALLEERRSLLVLFTLYRVLQAEEDAASAAMIASCG